ncbi:MAG: hypothetical protein GKR89_06180 [Candidatus Latescibacteria bacterium]|nr:hypothetical protein [Candidatus Latescibacterota bacterium]
MDKKLAKAAATAAAAGDLESVQQAVQTDAEIAAHWQVLMNACYEGQVEIVDYLIGQGADVNIQAPNVHRYRPLHRVVEFKKSFAKNAGHDATLDLLLQAGADPMLAGSYYLVSAVALAAFGSPQYVAALLKKAPRQLDIYTAAALGRAKRVAQILSLDPEAASRPDPASRDGAMLPLQYCARALVSNEKDHLATAAVLLEHGAEPASALDQSCWSGNVTVARLLLEKGGRLGDDDTVNHLACDGQFDILRLLQEYDAIDFNGTRGTDHHGGYNPLGCAVSMRSFQGVEWFLDQGCDPNKIKSKNGETALHVAVHFGSGVPLLQLLVERGAQADQKTKDGHTALDMARAKKKAKLVDYLAGL